MFDKFIFRRIAAYNTLKEYHDNLGKMIQNDNLRTRCLKEVIVWDELDRNTCVVDVLLSPERFTYKQILKVIAFIAYYSDLDKDVR